MATELEGAVAYALSRDVLLSEEYYSTLTAVQRKQAVSIAGLAEIEQVRYVMAQVNSALINGSTFEQFQQNVNLENIDLPRHRLKTIYQTNLQSAYSHGRWIRQQEDKKNKPYLMYVTKNDSLVRPEHQILHKTIRPIGDAFWLYNTPPLDFNCFLPETKISGNIEAAMVRSYEGVAVELVTRSGKTLSATSNHPILTDRGWVSMDSVKTGDNVLSYERPVSVIHSDNTSRQVNDKQAIPTAENLFKSIFGNTLAFGGVATLKFNSDVANGEININITDSSLVLNLKSNLTHGSKQISLVRRDNGSVDVLASCNSSTPIGSIVINTIFGEDSSDGGFAYIKDFCNSTIAEFGCSVEMDSFSFEFVIPSISGSPSSTALTLDTTLDLFNGLPLDRFRLGLGSHSDTIINEVASDGWSTDSNLFRYLIDTHSAEVLSDPVVNVRKFDFSGHVYDFQSRESLISANDIIAHNCRCRTLGITAEEAEQRGITLAVDLPASQAKNGFGHSPELYNDKFTELVNDRLSTLMLDNFKQSSKIAPISGRIQDAVTKVLDKPKVGLGKLIDAAKKLLGM